MTDYLWKLFGFAGARSTSPGTPAGEDSRILKTIPERFVERITVYDEVLDVEQLLHTLPADLENDLDSRSQQFPTRISVSAPPAASRMGRRAPFIRKIDPIPIPIPFAAPKTDDHIEKFEGRGQITVLEDTMPRGIIDGTYFFNKSKDWSEFKRGDIVDFQADRSEDESQWEVKYMKLYVTPEEEDKQKRRRFTTVVGIVDGFQNEFMKFKHGSDNFKDIQDIPISCLPTDYTILVGDYLRVKYEIDSLDEGCSTGKIHSVEPSKRKTLIGKVTNNQIGCMAIDNIIYFDQSVCDPRLRTLRPHDVVRVEAVEAKKESFCWRAIWVCRSNFTNYTAAQKQEEGWLDTENVWSAALTELVEDKFGVKVIPRKIVDFGAFKLGSTLVKVIDVENSSDHQITLKSITVQGDQSVCKFDVQIGRREADDIITIIEPGGSYNFKIKCIPTMLGSTRELCILNFDSFKIGRYLVVTCLSNQVDIVSGVCVPKQENRRQWKKADTGETIDRIIEERSRKIAPGVQLVRTPFFLPRRIPPNLIPKFMWEIVKNKDETELLKAFRSLNDVLNSNNYQEKFQVALWLEEMHNEILRRQYDLDNVVMRQAGPDYFSFEVSGLKDIHPPILQGDPLSVFDNADSSGGRYQGYIHEIRGSDIIARFGDAFRDQYKNAPVTVQFCMGRTTYKRAHYAVEQGVRYLGKDWLFPTDQIQLKPPRIPFIEEEDNEQITHSINVSSVQPEPTTLTPAICNSIFRKANQKPINQNPNRLSGRSREDKRSSNITDFVSDTVGPSVHGILKLKWFNKLLNTEQKDAVRRVLKGQGRPLPYIIFGPPGTGKTVTVVETILQIHKLDANSRILVCAPSNSAADIIAQHMVASNTFISGDFVRLVGFLRQDFQIPENIRDYCVDGDHLDTVARNRIIITTCSSAGQFFSLGLDSGHFTHVFIDEAGYCTEPEAIIASSLVALSKAGQVIFAGDPQQLGPVLMSDTATNCGLSLSFLERLMALPLYSRNEIMFPVEKYNPMVLTKLVKNYRAHPALLKLPSMLFYHDELESAVPEDEVNLCHLLNFLPCSGVPLLFHGLQGNCGRDRDSPSWFNAPEVIQVVEYVRKLRKLNLTNDDIGIITPYRKQVDKIRKALELGLLEDEVPKVGSVEEFQGGERKVVIMSMVRSARQEELDKVVDRMSFLYSAKRFNVAITRARSILIVIGNPHLLSLDPNWDKFLRYCLELGAYTGCNIPVSMDKAAKIFLANLEPNKAPVDRIACKFAGDNGVLDE